jgi:hypothetical protein
MTTREAGVEPFTGRLLRSETMHTNRESQDYCNPRLSRPSQDYCYPRDSRLMAIPCSNEILGAKNSLSLEVSATRYATPTGFERS